MKGNRRIRDELLQSVRRREARMLRRRREGEPNIGFWVGMFGLVGWSVAVPTLLGVALGIWLDRNLPAGFSWTLTLLFLGLVVGCLNAWYWIKRERDGDA